MERVSVSARALGVSLELAFRLKAREGPACLQRKYSCRGTWRWLQT